MRIPPNARALRNEENLLALAQTDQRLGKAVFVASIDHAKEASDAQHQQKLEQADQEHDGDSVLKLFSAIGTAVAVVGTAACAVGTAAFYLGIGGLAALPAAVVTVAAPAAVCGFIGCMIGKGVGALAKLGHDDDANDAKQAAAVADFNRKEDLDLVERSGTANIDRGRADAKQAHKNLDRLIHG